MNQAIEQALIDHTNKVWEQALKVGMSDERERIIKLLESKKATLENINLDHNSGSEINSIRTKTIGLVIDIIKGEK